MESTILPDRTRSARYAILLVAGIAVASCSNASRTLGLDPEPPDEFTVVSKAPLTIPPDFNLRPPQPGAPRPQELDPTSRAQAALVGDGPRSGGPTGATAGEAALLQVARADEANPEIRRVLNEETTQLAERDAGFVDRVLSRVRPQQGDDGETINAAEEERRLRQQESSLNTGAVDQQAPVIRRKSRSILSEVF